MKNPFRRSVFLCQALDARRFPPPGRREVCVAGRSNVGKSSFLNRLAGTRGLARISSKPGKTTALSFYHVEGWGLLVDLPGYGFAQRSHAMREEWKRAMDAYLSSRRGDRTAVVLVDGRIGPQEKDREMMAYLAALKIPHLTVATKMDKVPRGRWNAHLDALNRDLGLPAGTSALPFSAVTGAGFDAILAAILNPPRPDGHGGSP